MALLRAQLGNTVRGQRLRQRRTLRDVSGAARVSLGYLSEVERGQKEASSELLASICDALDVELADLLAEVSLELRVAGGGALRPVAPQGVPEVGARQRHGRLLSCERGSGGAVAGAVRSRYAAPAAQVRPSGRRPLTA